MSDAAKAAHELATAFAGMSEILLTALEASTGYRRQCEEAGFSPTAAELMAIDFHKTLLQMIIHSTTTPKEKR
jgi:hypothetical protein